MSVGIKLNYSIRRFTDDSVDVSDLKSNLSDFQIEKLTFLFKCFNQTNTGYIEVTDLFPTPSDLWPLTSVCQEEDIATVNELFRNIAGWEEDDLNYISMLDNNRVFLECLQRQVQSERAPVTEHLTWEQARRPSKITVASVSLKNWLNMWAKLFMGWAV